MDVVRLHRELHDAEARRRRALQSAAEGRKHTVASHRRQTVDRAQGDVHGMARAAWSSSPIRDAGPRRRTLANRARTATTPGTKLEREPSELHFDPRRSDGRLAITRPST